MNGAGRPAAAADVAVIGLGYVGLTLAVGLADAGFTVVGHDASSAVVGGVGEGNPPFREKGLAERLKELEPGRLTATSSLPSPLPPTVIICVGTPVDAQTGSPDLGALESVLAALAPLVGPETLVVLRSTVPVGTTRSLVMQALKAAVDEPLVAFAPERTIQGRALEELQQLPQIVGGTTLEAVDRAAALFGRLTPRVIRVSSLEAAEMVKLINNAHTDLIYGFGNEVALMAEAIGLDAEELIRSANLDYPRPDLSRPGFVGGSCLVKDPYLLIRSAEAHGYSAPMVSTARKVNEHMPGHVADVVLAALRARGRAASEAKVLVSGIAYKGRPETDDVRGCPAEPIGALLGPQVETIVGHDFVVANERIATLGLQPVSLEEGFEDADAALILNDHPGYLTQDVPRLVATMRIPIVFDAWGVFRDQLPHASDGMTYLRLGVG